MRRSNQPLLGVVLLAAGFVSNLPLVALSQWFGERWDVSRVVSSLTAVLAVVADGIWRMGVPFLRPFGIHRQVPQWYGHAHGAWRAAVRYGLRLGLGPATILTSWTWWVGMALCVLDGPRTVALGALLFVSVRTVTMFAATFGVGDGGAMAARSARIDATQRVVQPALAVVVVVAAVLGLAQ